MSRFIQLHLLTSYPPANLNRDDLGRPKTAIMGGASRLRVSSQSLKRAWRTSDAFEAALKGHVGTRTKMLGVLAYQRLVDQSVSHAKAIEWAAQIGGEFGNLKSLKTTEKKKLAKMDDADRLKQELSGLEIEQLVHVSPEEQADIDRLLDAMASRGSKAENNELSLLRMRHTAADIALFGRMLTYPRSRYSTEAAAQVAHAISVHAVAIEDDFFTAVDDLNNGEKDSGASHLGETEFAAGLFYLYLCIDKALLIKNLSDNEDLANITLAALIECAATVAPSGKQNSFGSRARASYLLCETGDQQPRSLSVSFLKPIAAVDMLDAAINKLTETIANMDKTYGQCADQRCAMNASLGEGSLRDVIQCAQDA